MLLSVQGTLSKSEWEASSLYCAFAFKKAGDFEEEEEEEEEEEAAPAAEEKKEEEEKTEEVANGNGEEAAAEVEGEAGEEAGAEGEAEAEGEEEAQWTGKEGMHTASLTYCYRWGHPQFGRIG